jgi:hypothetical protein
VLELDDPPVLELDDPPVLELLELEPSHATNNRPIKRYFIMSPASRSRLRARPF